MMEYGRTREGDAVSFPLAGGASIEEKHDRVDSVEFPLTRSINGLCLRFELHLIRVNKHVCRRQVATAVHRVLFE